jgi:hypothetical protein
MSKAAVSLFAVGLFLILTGIGFFIIPNFVLSLLRIPPTDEVWIRILGMLVLFIGYYYVVAARKELKEFFNATIHVRLICFLFFLVLVLTKIAYPILIIFGIIDLIGSIWTTWALKKE